MKAIILAGGKGVRLRPLTYTMAKQLIPVANRPIITLVLSQILKAGITDIGVVISPETGEEIKKALAPQIPEGISVTYILQDAPLGLAHAIKIARGFLENEPFLMFLGDNLLQNGVCCLVEEFNKKMPDALISIKEVKNPEAFGIVILDKEGRVKELIEKPPVPPTNLALVGVYLFSTAIHAAIDRIKPSLRGELEITDAIQELLNMGGQIEAQVLEGAWLDTGKKADILSANQIVLNDYTSLSIKGDVDTQSQINGEVEIGMGTKIINSTINGPVIIDKAVTISNCIIGPFTTIGRNSTLDDVTIEHSVILENCMLQGVHRIKDSLIGRNARISQNSDGTASRCLFIGDDSEVVI